MRAGWWTTMTLGHAWCVPAPARRGRSLPRAPWCARSRTAPGASSVPPERRRASRATATGSVPSDPPFKSCSPSVLPDTPTQARSELLARDLAHGEEVPRDINRVIRIEPLAGEDHSGHEARLGPYVERDPGVDQRDKGVVTLVLLVTQTSRREDRRGAVRPQLESRGEIVEVAVDHVFIDIGREVALDQQALPDDIGRQILHAAIVAPQRCPTLSPRPVAPPRWPTIRKIAVFMIVSRQTPRSTFKAIMKTAILTLKQLTARLAPGVRPEGGWQLCGLRMAAMRPSR